EGNLQQVIYTPIKSDATRIAALVSGEIDFVLDPSPRAAAVAALAASDAATVIEVDAEADVALPAKTPPPEA
ncbi:hypothetical protein ACVBEH_33270, partial [Roseateles sp. GG27B]